MVLKLIIDTKINRVLFAEAGKEVVDFIFGLLALPVGSIVNLLGQNQMVGSIGCIYSSLENFHSAFIQPHLDKDILLSSHVEEQRQCQINLLLPAKVKTYYGCHNYVSKVCGAQCPSCRCGMQRVLQYVHPEHGNSEREKGYVKGLVTYIIMDDLSVTPMPTVSSITLLNKFDVKNVNVLKEKNAMKLLKASFESKTVLTDVFLVEDSTQQSA
ncbi:hypothetical protein IHE45_12G081600 [Dioscorea alata]|uniref:Uncharacterized protein n=1 Tax=Dioscorea alata TaxID=55571 RepID=A0ACB7V3J2_DIOAL|nr:hypothetical protein IHE45_12G081600 [Dioscorea alata]